jgi:predicted nucleic acid-binding protein
LIVLDTSGLLAALDAGQRAHGPCAETLRSSPGPFLLSPFVLAELDYLLATRVGPAAQRALLAEVARGSYRLEPFSEEDVRRCLALMEKHADLAIGLADASVVILARRHRTTDVLTLDERHFRWLEIEPGRPARILPADA